MNYHSSFSTAFLLLIFCQIVLTASVGKSSASNETESDIDLVLDLLSGINFNVSDLNDDFESSTDSSTSTATTTSTTTTTVPETLKQQKAGPGKPFMPKWLMDYAATGNSNSVLGVPKLNLERKQPKGLDAYYPRGTQSLRNFAKNGNQGQGGLGGFGQGIWGLVGRSLGGGFGAMNPFRSIAMTLFGGKGSLRQKLWLVKELYREEEQNRRRQSFDRSTGDLRTRVMRSLVQKSFNHYKKNTAMMEMVVQDRNERLQRFLEIPGVAELLNSNYDNFSDENESNADALSLLSQTLFSLGGFLRNQM